MRPVGRRSKLFFPIVTPIAVSLTSCAAAEADQILQQRYGEAQYLYAGAGCETRGAEYVKVKRGELAEGIHRLALHDPAERYSAGDVYFDRLALPSEADQQALYSAEVDKPVLADVSGWRKDCGGNVIFLIDKIRLLK